MFLGKIGIFSYSTAQLVAASSKSITLAFGKYAQTRIGNFLATHFDLNQYFIGYFSASYTQH
jgi:hypothetical protein